MTIRLGAKRESRIRRWVDKYRKGEFAPSSLGHDHHLMLAEIDALRAVSDKHFRISMFKSMIRFLGYAALPFSIWGGALLLITAELLGVLEEM